MKKALSASVLLILALALAGPAVLADETATTGTTTTETTATGTPAANPVTTLTAYLQQANAPVETLTAVTNALNEALASGAVKSEPLTELVEAMVKAGVTPEVALQIAQRIDLMATEKLPFGQVMKEFRLLIKAGDNKGIDQALAQAQKFVEKQEGKDQAQNASQGNAAGRASEGKGNASEGKGGKK